MHYNGCLLFEPIKPIVQAIYICDKYFYLDPILDHYKNESSYGILLVSGERAICGQIIKSGTHIQTKIINEIKVRLQKRHNKGGQSAPRFGRIRQEIEEHYVKDVATMAINSYMKDNCSQCIVSSIIIAGPAELKHKVEKHPVYTQYLKDITIRSIDIDTVDSSAILTIYERSVDDFNKCDQSDSIALLDKIKTMMTNADDKLIFGFKEVCENLEQCMVEQLLISSSSDKIDIINHLNTYGCVIEVFDLDSMGIDMVGIKYY